jgi:hypothetical protein
MKKFIGLFLLVSILFLTGFYACELDDTNGLSSDPRDKYVGTWTCNETPASLKLLFTYPVEMVKDTTIESNILLKNFGFIGFDEKPPYGILSGSSISVPQQQVCYDNSITVYGEGTIVDVKTINWSYTIKVGGDKNSYNAVFTKND